MPQIDLSIMRAEIELDREWREKEIRIVKNSIEFIEKEEDKKLARKALLLLLYAHFEGLFKFILSSYLNAINKLDLIIDNVSPFLAAASLQEVFKEFRNVERKGKIFSGEIPDDAAFHRFARDIEFIKKAVDIYNIKVKIDIDLIVDTESNLKPVVLKKILFKMGIIDILENSWDGMLHRFLGKRNKIAHGIEKDGIEKDEYIEFEEKTFKIINDLIEKVSNLVSEDKHLK